MTLYLLAHFTESLRLSFLTRTGKAAISPVHGLPHVGERVGLAEHTFSEALILPPIGKLAMESSLAATPPAVQLAVVAALQIWDTPSSTT